MTASSGGPAPRSAARNAANSLLTQLITAALTAVLTLVLVRLLEPSGYGLFALALSIGGLALLPADFGINNATARLIAQRRSDAGAVRALFIDAVRLKVAVAGTLCAALFVVAGPIADAYGTPALAWPLRAVAWPCWARLCWPFWAPQPSRSAAQRSTCAWSESRACSR